MLRRVVAVAFCAAVLCIGGAAAGHAKSEKAHGAGKPAKNADTSVTNAVTAAVGALAGALLSAQDRSTIQHYFQQHPQPALALPPGIAKNVARGKPLPPGIAKRGVANALTGQLAIPKGYTLESVGADVVLIQAGTRIVADIVRDVLRK